MRSSRTGDQRLRAGMPPGWRIGEKTGTGPRGTSNDIGVLWPPGRAPVVLACFFLSAVVNLGLQQALLAPEYRRLADAGRDMSERRSWISYGLQMGATMLFIEYSKEITVLFSSLSLQPTDIARLSVALSFVGFARFAVIAVNQSITPDLSRSIAANDNGRLLDIVDRSSLMKITAALAGLVLFTLFGRQLLGLYDDEFAKAWWLLPVLAGLVFLGGKLAGLPGAATGATIGWVSFYGILSWLVWRERGVNLTLPGTLARRFAR
jgi:Na+-driven multidrug efflux pump